MDRTAAQRIAQASLSSIPIENDELVIVEESTIEKSYGWIFFYTSKKWLETGDFRYALGGNGPLLVTKDGSVHEIGSVPPVEDRIREVEERLRRTGKLTLG